MLDANLDSALSLCRFALSYVKDEQIWVCTRWRTRKRLISYLKRDDVYLEKLGICWVEYYHFL